MDSNTAAMVYLAVLFSLLFSIKKYSNMRVSKANVWGLEGAGGTITRMVKLDMVREGQFFKDSMTGRQFPIVTNPITISEKKKDKTAYLVDLENGCTVELLKDKGIMDIVTEATPAKPATPAIPATETTPAIPATPATPAIPGRKFIVKTNPDLISNILDSKIITDAFNIKPNRGMLIACLLIGVVVGLIMGKAF